MNACQNKCRPKNQYRESKQCDFLQKLMRKVDQKMMHVILLQHNSYKRNCKEIYNIDRTHRRKNVCDTVLPARYGSQVLGHCECKTWFVVIPSQQGFSTSMLPRLRRGTYSYCCECGRSFERKSERLSSIRYCKY